MRKDKGTRGDHKVVARAHPFAGGELKTVAVTTISGEGFLSIREERERGKRGEWERRARRRR